MSLLINDMWKAQHALVQGLLRQWITFSTEWDLDDPIVKGLAHYMHGQDLLALTRAPKAAPGLPTPDVSVPEMGVGAVVRARV
ncbi:hypothetical protein GGQ74_000302 [Desulfobaculum xiamenense]|uniref:Uncharacterized protein n=1 Tax=Desulfobaculum xiamenense TaxID=995050 RepID=A0A846QJK8_9BACT|nr:hypothetical protein [Desulfobaculum xiamenense]NJB66662.1 hypothetical protein [Desulfobaculum xiamenense]